MKKDEKAMLIVLSLEGVIRGYFRDRKTGEVTFKYTEDLPHLFSRLTDLGCKIVIVAEPPLPSLQKLQQEFEAQGISNSLWTYDPHPVEEKASIEGGHFIVSQTEAYCAAYKKEGITFFSDQIRFYSAFERNVMAVKKAGYPHAVVVHVCTSEVIGSHHLLRELVQELEEESSSRVFEHLSVSEGDSLLSRQKEDSYCGMSCTIM